MSFENLWVSKRKDFLHLNFFDLSIKLLTIQQVPQCIWNFHFVRCNNQRQACGDLYEQFQIQEATVGTAEVQIFIRRNSGYFIV